MPPLLSTMLLKNPSVTPLNDGSRVVCFTAMPLVTIACRTERPIR
jgi:hypothetical protein